MSVAEWGPWANPDTEQGMQRYREQGLVVSDPEVVRAMDQSDLLDIARQCGALLQEVYNGGYPLSSTDAEQFAASVKKGDTNLFTLTANNTLVGMAAIVDQPNKVGGNVRMSELGRAGGRNPAGQPPISLRGLLTNRVPWATQNVEADFLYSYTRAAAEPRGCIPSGKGVQSVWWGGRRYGGQTPHITTNAGWYYNVGSPEPFNGFAMPTNPAAWAESAAQHPVFVGSQDDVHVLSTLVNEGTRGKVQLAPQVAQAKSVDVGLTPTQPASDKVAGSYAVSDKLNASHDLTDVDSELKTTFAQRIVIEADIATTPAASSIMNTLGRAGWTTVGWEPSGQEYGVICPVLSRVNPDRMSDLVSPRQHPEYFDRAGLPGTRVVLDGIFAALLYNADQRKVA